MSEVEDNRTLIRVDLGKPHIWMTLRKEGDLDWEILGVYTSTEKQRAILRCKRPSDYVVAMPLNVDLPDHLVSFDTEEWPL